MGDECVKVVVRSRPLFGKEIKENRKNIVEMRCELGQVQIRKPSAPEVEPKAFTFDSVYDEHSTQRAVYDETGYPLVESVMQGYNGTMFAYGQTGCGKTHTMQGKQEPPELRGIIPNSFDHIFENIKIQQAESEREFMVQCSYLEIYNEEIRDLLGLDPKARLDLKENPEKGVFVKGQRTVVVDSVEAIDKVMRDGYENRTVGATLMNAESSRSHSIFTIIIDIVEKREDGSDHFVQGKLNLVDLAGSERPSKTGATGARMKEGIKINMSLTALGNVISCLVEGKGKHIPYRDSKLTRLLQDSLGGNTKTVMMAAIGPADYNYDETMSTLRYANRAKNIKNKPSINEDPKDALLRQYKDEIDQLKKMLESHMAGGGGAVDMDAMMALMNKHGGGGESAAPAGAAAGAGGAAPAAAPVAAVAGAGVAMVPRGPSAEPQVKVVVEKEIVVEKEVVVEKELVEVVPKHMLAQQAALKEYNDSILDQRNRMGEELEKKAEEAEAERRNKEMLEEKLKSLQSRLLGGSMKALQATEDDEALQAAKQAAAYRKAQLKLKQQKKREAKLKEEQMRAREEAAQRGEEAKVATEEAESKSRDLRAVKRQYQAKRRELSELQDEFSRQRETLMNTVREQAKESKLLEQLVALFLPSSELGKVWERAVWNEEDQEWDLPAVKPRAAYSQVVKLPGLGRGGPPMDVPDDDEDPGDGYKGGAFVTDDYIPAGGGGRSGSRSDADRPRSRSREAMMRERERAMGPERVIPHERGEASEAPSDRERRHRKKKDKHRDRSKESRSARSRSRHVEGKEGEDDEERRRRREQRKREKREQREREERGAAEPSEAVSGAGDPFEPPTKRAEELRRRLLERRERDAREEAEIDAALDSATDDPEERRRRRKEKKEKKEKKNRRRSADSEAHSKRGEEGASAADDDEKRREKERRREERRRKRRAEKEGKESDHASVTPPGGIDAMHSLAAVRRADSEEFSTTPRQDPASRERSPPALGSGLDGLSPSPHRSKHGKRRGKPPRAVPLVGAEDAAMATDADYAAMLKEMCDV